MNRYEQLKARKEVRLYTAISNVVIMGASGPLLLLPLFFDVGDAFKWCLVSTAYSLWWAVLLQEEESIHGNEKEDSYPQG